MTMPPSSHPVLTAMSSEGHALPVLDVTNPAFAPGLDVARIPDEMARYISEEKARRKAPIWVTRIIFWIVGRRSPLLRAVSGAREFLPGLTTYLLKLGPNHLVKPFDGPVDKAVANSLPARSTRVRMENVARLLATALAPQLAQQPDAPLALINIAGGPAMDSINALLLLRQDHAALLEGRSVTLYILDIDAGGPGFATAALAALRAEGAPLAGVDARVEHRVYDWTQTGPLSELLAGLRAGGAVIAVSSEGGLFEYGDDQAIKTNLGSLQAGLAPGSAVVGSVTSDNEATRLLNSSGVRFGTIPRGLAAFRALAEEAGFDLEESLPAAMSDEVWLSRR
ncbi:MAG TPA: hypothetical protein VGM83_02110 [Devosiaceae bacterium]|jgi:hypothetical protein